MNVFYTLKLHIDIYYSRSWSVLNGQIDVLLYSVSQSQLTIKPTSVTFTCLCFIYSNQQLLTSASTGPLS